jgi:hypothetical protein
VFVVLSLARTKNPVEYFYSTGLTKNKHYEQTLFSGDRGFGAMKLASRMVCGNKGTLTVFFPTIKLRKGADRRDIRMNAPEFSLFILPSNNLHTSHAQAFCVVVDNTPFRRMRR